MPFLDLKDATAKIQTPWTQVPLEEAWKLIHEGSPEAEYIRIFISLRKHRQPKHWKGIGNPVCELRLNLYGHPLAGLLWERHCQHWILDAGFEKVTGWECLLVHLMERFFPNSFSFRVFQEKSKECHRIAPNRIADAAARMSVSLFSLRRRVVCARKRAKPLFFTSFARNKNSKM